MTAVSRSDMTIIGPSYALNTSRAAVQRSINYMLRPIEPGNEKSAYYLQQCPGLRELEDAGAAIRCLYVARGRGFAVAGNKLYEVQSDWTLTELGTLQTASGRCEMAEGLTSVVLVDGSYGYVLTLATDAFSQITDSDFLGSKRVSYLDGRWYFADPDTQVFFWTESIDNATSYDALDFASAESQPDTIVAHIVNFREVVFAGENNTEVWSPNPTGEQPLVRNSGQIMEVGCLAPFSLQKIDNGLMWVGQDKSGQGIVWRITDYRPQRASTAYVEQILRGSSDLSQATAFVYQQNGQAFYCLTAPGLDRTLVFDASLVDPRIAWHDRCELEDGDLQPWRITTHAFMHGANVGGSDDGKLYAIDPAVNTNAGDVLYRERTSPHQASPGQGAVFIDEVRLDVTVGMTEQGVEPAMEMQVSKDGGKTWGNWMQRSLGEIGEYGKAVRWHRLGRAKDPVFRFRCTDNCEASIVNAAVRAIEGSR